MRPFVHRHARVRAVLLLASLVLLALPAAKAAADVFDFDIPVNGATVLQPCSGEVVTLQGTMHLHATTEMTDDGDVFIAVHSETHGMSGTTSVTFPGEQPRKYVANEIDDQILHTRLDGGPETTTTHHDITFVRTGEADGAGILCCGDDFLLHMSFHFTFVNGRLTAAPDNVRAECK
jgi:hypothetical protein